MPMRPLLMAALLPCLRLLTTADAAAFAGLPAPSGAPHPNPLPQDDDAGSFANLSEISQMSLDPAAPAPDLPGLPGLVDVCAHLDPSETCSPEICDLRPHTTVRPGGCIDLST
jgi:hypothetical protein